MKTAIIAAALALVQPDAAAQHWESRNKAGGRIILTEATCPAPGMDALLLMWTEMPDGQLLEGCWTIYADRVQVIYKTGERYSYEPANFKRRERPGAPARKGAL